MKKMEDNEYITIPQLAEILGISRVAVYKKVKKGEIEAIRIGRNFAIPKKTVAHILGNDLTDKDKKEIDKVIKKTIEEYGEVLERLGNE
ncbi:MAG: helix-turn-helix domain-containing protein [Candidatus Aminicenantes bacterium]